MRIIFKLIKICIVFCALFLVSVFSVSADNRADEKFIEEYITESLSLMLEKIDVYEFGCREDVIFNVLDRVMKANPNFYYVGNRFTYTTDDDGIVKEIFATYVYSSREVKNISAYCDGELSKILFSIDGEMNELQRVLTLHEYMCENFSYDESLANYTMYDLLRTGRGTCQAFTLTYMELLSRAGVESSYAYSNEIMHIWNLVKVDGEWYHIDLTWDDVDVGVSHKNFLLSDKGILESGHKGFINADGIKCSSERFESLPLRESPYKYVCFADGVIYVDNISRSVYFDRLDGRERVSLYRIDELWQKSEGRYYANSFSVPVRAGNKVYFNTKTAVMEIDEELAVRSLMKLDFDAFGMADADGRIVLYFDKNGEDLRELGVERSLDADGDGEVTVLDLAIVDGYFSARNEFFYKYNVDANGDRQLDHEDVTALERCLVYGVTD